MTRIVLTNTPNGPSFGVVRDGSLVVPCGPWTELGTLLETGSLAQACAGAMVAGGGHPLDPTTLLPFLLPGASVFCAGKNYQSHAEESGRTAPKPDVGFFVKVASALVAHEQPVVVPRVSAQLDFEGELCVVIGRPGRHIAAADALSHVAGYTCLMDGSVRDYQKNSVAAGKNFERSGAVGPWMVTADEVPDPAALTLTTRVNGTVVQQSGVDRLIHDIPKMIAYLSGITTLRGGDLIATGTPEGVGQYRKPPMWLRAGDVVEVDIPGVGTLSNPVVAEPG